MFKRGLILALLAILTISCEDEDTSLVFSEFSIERSYENCDPEVGKCSFISMDLPLVISDNIKSKNINDAIEAHIISIVDFQDDVAINSLEELADRFIENYKTTNEEFNNEETPWEASVLANVSLESEKLISMKFEADIFTGGAHGFQSTSFLNFNPANGNTYSQSELFTDAFLDYAEQLFRSDNNIPAEEPLNASGIQFEKDTFELPSNIGFTNNELILYYNTYEISTYSVNPMVIKIPLSEAETYLKLQVTDDQ